MKKEWGNTSREKKATSLLRLQTIFPNFGHFFFHYLTLVILDYSLYKLMRIAWVTLLLISGYILRFQEPIIGYDSQKKKY